MVDFTMFEPVVFETLVEAASISLPTSWAKIPRHSSKGCVPRQGLNPSWQMRMTDIKKGSLINMGNLDYNPNCSGDKSTYNR